MNTTSPHRGRRARTLLSAVAAVALTGGLATGGAQAAGNGNPNDPALFVPADKIEHVVRVVEIKGDLPTVHERQELWLTADRGRMRITNLQTGRVRSDRRFRHQPATAHFQSLAQEAAIWRDAFTAGSTRQVGETQRFGRRALVLESVRENWTTDEPEQVTTMVVDAETFTPYGIRTELAAKGFSQDVTVTLAETLDRAKHERVLTAARKGPSRKAKARKKRNARRR